MKHNRRKERRSIWVFLYLCFSAINFSLFKWLILRRKSQGKEHPSRYIERLGYYSAERPSGRLIWFNAVSVGEALSLKPVVQQLLNKDTNIQILITTTTVASAEILEKTFPQKVIHQFAPVDNATAIQKFFKHWKPNIAVWCESELWPCMIAQTKKLNIPMYLINARISEKTMKTWRKIPNTTGWLITAFDKIFTQTSDMKRLLLDLGCSSEKVIVAGSTKEDTAKLSYDTAEYTKLSNDIADRPVWVAASTHSGEETIILDAHKKILESISSNSLLILAPRHPNRSTQVEKLIQKKNLQVATRSKNDPIVDETQVYLADTVGEMGLWFELSKIILMGGSLVNVGGHNPYEPIAMGGAILTGTFVGNFAEIYERLNAHKACIFVNDSLSIAEQVAKLMDSEMQVAYSFRAQQIVQENNLASKLIAEQLHDLLEMKYL